MPVFQILLQDERAHVRVQMEDTGPINVEDGVEAVPVPVEEVFRNVLKKNNEKKSLKAAF